MSHWFLGTIGFSYKDWMGGFYPPGTSQREYLHYYCKYFNTVELDTTFHSIPQRANVENWAANTPDDFIFCLKSPRAITHELRLRGAASLMTEFIETVSPLQQKLGPILLQLPPSYTQDNISSLSEFLDNIPHSYRFALEFRHLSWYNHKTADLLSQHKVCWVTIDYPNLPGEIIPTTDFLYIRWIGVNGMYRGHSYERVDKSEQLKSWIKAITPHLEKTSAIYGFFNNDYAGFAAGTCKRFMRLAGLAVNDKDMPHQERLF